MVVSTSSASSTVATRIKRELRVVRALVRTPDGFDFKPPKTARGRRVIPLPEPAVVALQAQRQWIRQARLFANNAHVRAVQELLGHSRSDMTLEIYTSSVPDVLRTTAALDSLFDEALQHGARR
jgi:integrase